VRKLVIFPSGMKLTTAFIQPASLVFDWRSPIGGYPQLRQGGLDAERAVVGMHKPNVRGDVSF
jgi:hypothetical protein